MGNIFGSLSLSDTDRVFNSTAGQQVIYEAAAAWLADRNAELDAALAVFVGETTEDYKRRYKLPGGGYLQKRDTKSQFSPVKGVGSWDIALPLEDFGAAIAGDDVSLAYMTVRELEQHINTVWNQNLNTTRFEMLKALMNDTADSFVDQLWGTLTVQPLANGDSTTYPPVLGSATEATEDHYSESGYTVANIGDSNNPLATISGELEEHFGAPTGGSNIAVFIPPDVTPYVRALSEFVSTADMGINYGATADIPNIPMDLGGIGRVVGRAESSGVWVVEWRYLPATYVIGIHLDAPKPLMRRVDPADTGLPVGLSLVANDEKFPFVQATWRNRFGFGVGNRLNGVVMEIAATGNDYTIPTAYA